MERTNNVKWRKTENNKNKKRKENNPIIDLERSERKSKLRPDQARGPLTK